MPSFGICRRPGPRRSVVLDLELVAFDRRKAVGEGTQSKITAPFNSEFVECSYAGLGALPARAVEMTPALLPIAHKFKSNLELAVGHQVARLIQDRHPNRRLNHLILLRVRRLNGKDQPARAGSAATAPPADPT